MRPIAFDDQSEIERYTLAIMHPEPFLHLILDLPTEALVSNDKEIIDVQDHCGDDCALILKHEQSCIDT
jgi:hypothetical protein